MVSCAFCFWRSLFCLLVFVFKWYCSLLQKCTLPKIAVFSLMFQGFCSLQKCCNCLRVHRNDFARRSKFTTNHHFVKPAVEFYFCKCCCSQFSSSHMILFVTYNYLGRGGVMPYLESDIGEMRGKEGRQMENHMQQGSPASGSWSAPEPLHHQAAPICSAHAIVWKSTCRL